MKSGFTLIEIIIVVAILATLIIGAFSANLLPNLQKGRDSKRKQDLQKITRVLEDYYNDNDQYPPQVSGQINGVPWGDSFSPYTSTLPKDPQSPGRNYLYSTSSLGNYFVVFSTLENTLDADIGRVGCDPSCGPDISNQQYNFAVHSGNVRIENGVPVVN